MNEVSLPLCTPCSHLDIFRSYIAAPDFNLYQQLLYHVLWRYFVQCLLLSTAFRFQAISWHHFFSYRTIFFLTLTSFASSSLILQSIRLYSSGRCSAGSPHAPLGPALRCCAQVWFMMMSVCSHSHSCAHLSSQPHLPSVIDDYMSLLLRAWLQQACLRGPARRRRFDWLVPLFLTSVRFFEFFSTSLVWICSFTISASILLECRCEILIKPWRQSSWFQSSPSDHMFIEDSLQLTRQSSIGQSKHLRVLYWCPAHGESEQVRSMAVKSSLISLLGKHLGSFQIRSELQAPSAGNSNKTIGWTIL